MHRQLDEKTYVSGQIHPDEVQTLKELGVTLIVNNRPDNEDVGQPEGEDIEAAAKAAGIDYRHVPIARGMGPSDVEAMREAIHSAGDGKLFAFCRSGNRSTLAWAIARSEDGVSREELDRCASQAGFDLGPVAHLLRD
ncbi:TIGR01244 family sulfur transferase [Sphingomonas sp. NSE70-1]|uniref:TIGR01244 family sulfur transferase n=1 Tax=Sphingomonas caseinilyticus TaxID=2908205 RepID=A0ABT0RV37_9SPHN|nr:TIGR01244 family sulfur transferase [Sphingomonas caseinilyticus]MCL6698859.1 TIGR01244 family sulfur transferase [Sphingomonas caseinilyticus]